MGRTQPRGHRKVLVVLLCRHRWIVHASTGRPDPGRIESAFHRVAVGGAVLRPSRFCNAVAARVAKLVDAPGLGPNAFTGVPVRVRPRAPDNITRKSPSWP